MNGNDCAGSSSVGPASVAPWLKPTYSVGPSAMYCPKRARAATVALSTRRRIVSALSHAKRVASIFEPCGHTTKAYSEATMRHPPHAHSARSPAPCTATISGRGSRAASGGQTYASCPSGSSRCSIQATPSSGGSPALAAGASCAGDGGDAACAGGGEVAEDVAGGRALSAGGASEFAE